MTTRRSRLGVLAAVAFASTLVAPLVLPTLAHAQQLYGSIVGQVSDPQGAALPGVAVTATNSGTGLKVEAVTDGTGTYNFRNLPPGTYDLAAALTGFKELRQTGLAVTAGNPRRVDLTLQLGGMQETVNVTAESTIIKTENAELNTELSSKAVTTLPLNQYRNYQQLLNLVPGATPTMFQNAEIDTPGRSLRTFVNGTQPNSNTTRVDGAVSVNIWLPHHVGYVQPAETIDTVNVATNSFDADVGMAGGAAQTVVTKSGTNELKGSAFWFTNDDALNANTFFNNAFNLPKTPLSRNTYGGTLGGPIVKNKFFYFGSWEHFRDRRTANATYGVPTAKMRNGDFSEVAAAYPSFQLLNPLTGGAGTGRAPFAGFQIPARLISPIARQVLQYYPAVNSSSDLNSNGLLDDYVRQQQTRVDRDNYDLKLTWQRNPAHSIWGKFSMLRAKVTDNYSLGFENGSLGDTKVYVGAIGHTWTLAPTLVLDGNFGYNRQDQTVTGPDYGQNLGINLGIPGTNDPNDIRASGLPTFGNGYDIGTTPNWMPLFRKEITYTFSSALTKVFPKHEVRAGVDVVRMDLNHRQAEFGSYGLKGGFGFSGDTTGGTGYTSLQWNQFAAFMLGLPNSYAKDTQTEEMTGREWQSGYYVRDRWRPTERLTVNAGLRLEYYPLMRRANHGIERLDYNTYTVLIGGLGDVPEDVGIKLKTWYLNPRVGAAYRLGENMVVRAGYGRNVNPLPWSRPMRGSFPYDINFNASAEAYGYVTSLASGIPAVVVPDISSGRVPLPKGVFMRSPNPNDVDRGIIQQWNVAFERKLPGDISAEVAYVGTRTDGGYADLNINYGEPGGGNASRKYFGVAGTTAINDWASRTKARYNGLQVALNRPFRSGLMLKGAYTFSRARNMTDEDGWVGVTWNNPLVYDKNYALASFDRTHVFQMGFVYELPFLRENTAAIGKVLGGWQVNGIFAYYTGTPFSISGSNASLNCPDCGSVLINVQGDPSPTGTVGSTTDKWYDPSLFSQPAGLGRDGFGNSARNQFRRPSVWNLDLSLFKAFQIGRVRPEIRIEAANLFNHTNWGAPVTTFTANNFMQFTPGSTNQTSTVSGDIPGNRRVQLGLRVAF
jgi:hypothetical protein